MQVGDQVLSRNPATGKDEAKTVTNTIERHAPSVVNVVLHDSKTSKAETLTCTPEHPLYVQGQGWEEAGSLGIGTSIVSRAGPALEVTDLTWQKNKAQELAAGTGSSLGGYTVYNLTVEDDHTFFVGTTGGGTWVHNEGCTIIGRIKDVDAYIEKFPGQGPFNRYNPSPSEFRWSDNVKFLQDAVGRGDKIISASDPWTLGQKYIPGESNGFFTGQELKVLQGLGKSVSAGWLKL